jgi:hypothetical protein
VTALWAELMSPDCRALPIWLSSCDSGSLLELLLLAEVELLELVLAWLLWIWL